MSRSDIIITSPISVAINLVRLYFQKHMECAVLKRFLNVQGTFSTKSSLQITLSHFGKLNLIRFIKTLYKNLFKGLHSLRQSLKVLELLFFLSVVKKSNASYFSIYCHALCIHIFYIKSLSLYFHKSV